MTMGLRIAADAAPLLRKGLSSPLSRSSFQRKEPALRALSHLPLIILSASEGSRYCLQWLISKKADSQQLIAASTSSSAHQLT